MKTQQNKENDIPLDNHNTMSNINNDYVDNGKEELNTPLLSSSSSSSSSSSTSLQHHNNNDNNNNVMNTMTTQSNNVCTTFFHHIITIYTNQSPSTSTLFQGLSFIFILGTILGTIMPKNPNLSSMIYQYISSIIGYTYFICWSVSFYPQIITNYKNKSTLGLSVDGSLLAVLNYICYSIYNVFFYFDDTIRDEYKHRYNHHNGHEEEEEEGSDITVMSNDVAFALNALFLTIIIVLQIIYYNHKKNRFNHNNNEGSIVAQPLLPISKSCWWIIVMTIGISLIQVFCILIKVHGFLWIDFLYFMGGVKLILTIMTYIPQIMLNFQRKSTDGFNIWNVIFDFLGGLLSLIQLVFDCLDMNNFDGIFGNWAKFVLSLITLVFDGIYFTQHYILYRNNSVERSDTVDQEEVAEEEIQFFYNRVEEDTDENGEQILTEFV